MSIKNSFKLLLNRFDIVGGILLFLLIFFVLFCGLGAIYVQPILQAAIDLDFKDGVVQFYSAVLSKSEYEVIFDRVKDIIITIKSIFIGDEGLILKTVLVPVLFFVTFNLLCNMYELPLCKVLEARMSSNAKISLIGNVISLSGKSVVYVLVKLLFTVITDSIIVLAMWQIYKLLLLSSMILLLPFVELFVLLVLISLKKCFTVTWVPNMIVGEKNIFKAFGKSIKDGFRHFWSTFAGHFVCWLIVLVVNILMALLTFGVGLIVSIPVSILFIKLLEMTSYYSWHGKRYYLDGSTIVGPKQILTDKLD